MRGPALLATAYIGARPDLTDLYGLAGFAAGLGYGALQLPVLNPAILDLDRAAESDLYCSEVRGVLAAHGLALAGLAAARFGHFLAVPPGGGAFLPTLAPAEVKPTRQAWRAWAEQRFEVLARACRRLSVGHVVTFGGSLLWPAFYPFPPLAEEDVAAAFRELAARWRPIHDQMDDCGVDLCFELHPGSDLHDGVTYERFLAALWNHRRCALNYDPSHLLLQHIDHVGFIDVYGERIGGFHVKDAEFVRSPRTGVYGGYQPWSVRAGRFRSPGNGQIDFQAVFAHLSAAGFAGWPVLEWECVLKDRFTSAAEGAALIKAWQGQPAQPSFDEAIRKPLPRKTMDDLLGDVG